MKTIIQCLCIVFAFIYPFNINSQNFYDINTVNTIYITFPQANWDYILDSLYNAGQDRLLGSALINGINYDSIGVKYKGSSSYNPSRKKNPINIKLDYIIDDQRLEGYGTFKLSNVFKDPSFAREVLSYEIARKYMPAGLSNFIDVYINDTLVGLYVNDQSVDKFFLSNHFYGNDNAFFKGEIADGAPQGNVWGYYGTDSTNYFNYYEIESDLGWSDLICFLDIFNNNTALIENVLDVDRLLWMLAFDNLMVNLDAPINFGHNFYLYKDNSGQFNPIIWDLNENFGGFTSLVGGSPLNLAQMQRLDPFLNATNPKYPIINKVLSDSTYRRMYIAHMKTILAENFLNDWYFTRAFEIQAIVDSFVKKDPNKFYTYNDFKNNVYNSAGTTMKVVGIVELMNTRISYLNSLPVFQYAAPSILNISYTPSNVLPNSTVWFSVEADGANSVILGYRHTVTDKFTKIKMFDDGTHNDGTAGDGTYGASVQIGKGELQYYVYAENNDAGIFSPERAEHEFYSLSISGSLVINEFLALNSTTAADQDGEYDDWIELYNNSDNSISLNGYYLTDDVNNLTRWTFPDTSINANDYLIVWADDDTLQPGLHANFKLSGAGESIILSSPAKTIVDEVIFSQQKIDTSTGRYPNGTGAFIQMRPTFSAENDSGFGVEENSYQTLKKVTMEQNFPNPFNLSTKIMFNLPGTKKVKLTIYNVSGQEVTTLINNQKLNAGNHKITFNATNLSTGIYWYRLDTGDFKQTKKMILVK